MCLFHGLPDLGNVVMSSDRGYVTPSLVFDYLLKAGAGFIATVKRMQCWPFTYDQKQLSKNDKRMWVESKGAATLFLKYINRDGIKVTASAFRNGSNSVSTTVSTVHRGHCWEGICLDWREGDKYQCNPVALEKNAFIRHIYVEEEEADEEKELIENIKENLTCVTL